MIEQPKQEVEPAWGGYVPQPEPKAMLDSPLFPRMFEYIRLLEKAKEDQGIKFRRLADQWRSAVRFTSSYTERVMHPAYQTIIGMGPDAVPLILQELRANGGHWFWALRAITEEDPVPEEDEGKVKKMREAWLAWGRNSGII